MPKQSKSSHVASCFNVIANPDDVLSASVRFLLEAVVRLACVYWSC